MKNSLIPCLVALSLLFPQGALPQEISLPIETQGTAAHPDDIQALRSRQAQELKSVENKFHARARSENVRPGTPEYDRLLQDYRGEVGQVRENFLRQDTRKQSFDAINNNQFEGVYLTGSSAKDVRADLDAVAASPAAAQKIHDHWRSLGHEVEIDPSGKHKLVNKTLDATVWLPERTDAGEIIYPRYEAKLNDADAFSTSGGQRAAGVTTETPSATGQAADHSGKFLHAAAGEVPLGLDGKPLRQAPPEPDFKTMGKSLAKAVNESGITPSADQKQVLDSARTLQNYGDPFEAGIEVLGDDPARNKQRAQEWTQKATRVMDQVEVELTRQGTEQSRQRTQSALDLLEQANCSQGAERQEFLRQASEISAAEDISAQRNADKVARNDAERSRHHLTGRDAKTQADLYEASGQAEMDEWERSLRRDLDLDAPDKFRESAPGQRESGLMPGERPRNRTLEARQALPDSGDTARAKAPSSTRLQKAGTGASIVGAALAYQDQLNKLEKGENVYFQLQSEDGTLTKHGKVALSTMAEMVDIPGTPINAAETGRSLGNIFAEEFDQNPDQGILMAMTRFTVRAAGGDMVMRVVEKARQEANNNSSGFFTKLLNISEELPFIGSAVAGVRGAYHEGKEWHQALSNEKQAIEISHQQQAKTNQHFQQKANPSSSGNILDSLDAPAHSDKAPSPKPLDALLALDAGAPPTKKTSPSSDEVLARLRLEALDSPAARRDAVNSLRQAVTSQIAAEQAAAAQREKENRLAQQRRAEQQRVAQQRRAEEARQRASATPVSTESDEVVARLQAQQQALASELARQDAEPVVVHTEQVEGPAPGERTKKFFEGVGKVARTTGKVVGTVAKTGLEVTGAVVLGVGQAAAHSGPVYYTPPSSPPSYQAPVTRPSSTISSTRRQPTAAQIVDTGLQMNMQNNRMTAADRNQFRQHLNSAEGQLQRQQMIRQVDQLMQNGQLPAR